MSENTDIKYMKMALKLAAKAKGLTSPNPAVGAIIVKKNKILGKGYHKRAGLPHAEIEAINDAKKKSISIKGSTLYVTLEPCCHNNKRTPPCIDTVIKEGFSRVVIGTLDKNPEVKGRSVKILKKNNIVVSTGVLEEQCYRLNESFFKFITKGIPFVILKMAATLDGKIASYTGDSKWIGSEKQRKYAHRLRSENDAVLAGINTVISDNPMLNVRFVKTRKEPRAVVLDSKLRIPLDSNLVTKRNGTIIFTSDKIKKNNKKQRLENEGVEIIGIKLDKSGNIDIHKALKKLGSMGITSLLVEGGGKVAADFLKHKFVDKVVFFYSPKIVGGDGINMVEKLGIQSIQSSIHLQDTKIKIINGDEILIKGYIRK